MVLNFLENDKLSEDDIEELREILNKRTTKGINKYVCPILYTILLSTLTLSILIVIILLAKSI